MGGSEPTMISRAKIEMYRPAATTLRRIKTTQSNLCDMKSTTNVFLASHCKTCNKRSCPICIPKFNQPLALEEFGKKRESVSIEFNRLVDIRVDKQKYNTDEFIFSLEL